MSIQMKPAAIEFDWIRAQMEYMALSPKRPFLLPSPADEFVWDGIFGGTPRADQRYTETLIGKRAAEMRDAELWSAPFSGGGSGGVQAKSVAVPLMEPPWRGAAKERVRDKRAADPTYEPKRTPLPGWDAGGRKRTEFDRHRGWFTDSETGEVSHVVHIGRDPYISATPRHAVQKG